MSIEIMSPVGSYESLMAAIQAGAGSVYFGVGKMNMRSRSAANFDYDDLQQITQICREHNVRSYLTVNTVVYNNEVDEVVKLVDLAQNARSQPLSPPTGPLSSIAAKSAWKCIFPPSATLPISQRCASLPNLPMSWCWHVK